MSNTPTHYSEYIKQGVFVILILSISLFGIKKCRKYQKKRQVIIELSSHASESAAYEQFYTENAHHNLFQSMHQIHLGVELGLTPSEIVKKVTGAEDDNFMSSEKQEDLPTSIVLIREALLSNYDNCVKLGIFDDSNNLESLSKGEAPTIGKGPAAGEVVVIQHVISSSILPGIDKLLPNLVISPPAGDNKKDDEPPFDNFKIARAKKLAESLSRADLIEREASRKVIDYYDQNKAPKP